MKALLRWFAAAILALLTITTLAPVITDQATAFSATGLRQPASSGDVASAAPAMASITGSADLAVSKIDSVDPVDANQPLSYDIKVTNQGPHGVGMSNRRSISIPDSGNASPHPSTITVSGLSGTVSKIKVTLNGLSHTYPDDVDIHLKGPNGVDVILMSDAGGSCDISNVTLTFDDAVASNLPGVCTIASGTYRPGDHDDTGFIASSFSVYNGINPNGTWSLYVRDDQASDSGSIISGWSLYIETANTFSNLTPISIPDSGNASPFPSNINVSGISSPVIDVEVTLTGLNHTWPDDMDILLVGPGGQRVMLMSDAGGSCDISNVTLTFDDAGSNLPDDCTIASGTYRPTDYVSGDPPPPISGSYGTSLSVYNGLNPNGTWSLYVHDDAGNDTGSIVSGWSLTLITHDPQNDAVRVVDTLPAGFTFNGVSGSGWSCSYDSGTRRVTCTRPSAAVGEAVPVITVNVTAPIEGGIYTNNVSVSSRTTNDPSGGNNAFSETTTVRSIADLQISKLDNPDPVKANATLYYTLRVTNRGPSTANNVTVVDTLPPGTVFQSASGTNWSCSYNSSTHRVTCIRSLALTGTPATTAPDITIAVTPPPVAYPYANITNSASVSGNEIDRTIGNNTATATTRVTAYADLAISKRDDPDPVDATSALVYTIEVSNAGPSPAQAITVTDTLPAEVTFNQVTGENWDCSEAGGTVTCTLPGPLASGETASPITINVTAPTDGGSVTNVARVTSVVDDDNTANDSHSEVTTIRGVSNLTVSKTASEDVVDAGSTFEYRLVVSNGGPSRANSIVVQDTLPVGMSVISVDNTANGWNCSYNGVRTVTCSRSTLAVGPPAPEIILRVRAPSEGGNITNSVYVSSLEKDPDLSGNYAEVQTTVTPVANLRLTKSDTPDPVYAGETINYTLQVRNIGPSTAESVSVVDTLPDGVTNISFSGTGWDCTRNDLTVSCFRASLAAGATAPNISISVTAPVEGTTLTNSATVSSSTKDPNNGNNTATATTIVRPKMNLSIAKIDQPDPVDAAQPLTYTLNVANAGPSTIAPITVTDTLPAGVIFDSFVDVDASWTCSYDGATRTITCIRSDLAVGNAPAITIRMTAPSEGTSLTNTAVVSTSAYDPATGNNTATATTTVRAVADLALSKTASHDPAYAGELLTYMLRISNAGPSTATPVTVTDMLPAGATLISYSPRDWGCAQAGSTVTCSKASLSPGQIADVEIVVQLPSEGGLIINSASVSAVTFDPDTSNNTASASTTVIARADLALVKSDDPDPVDAASTLTYTLQVSNAGPSTLQTRTTTFSATEAVTMPGTGFGPATPYSSTLTVAAITGKVTKVTVTLNDLSHTWPDDVDILLVGPGGQAVLLMSDAGGDNALSNATLTFDDAAAVALPDSTAISSGSYRPANYTGNDGTGDSFSDPAPAAPYATTLGVFNNLDPNGPWRLFLFDDGSGYGGSLGGGWQLAITTEEAVTVVDTLPAEVSYVTAGGAGWSCAYASATHQVICQRDTLLVETAPAITIQVTAPVTGTVITNTAVLSGTVLDHFPANNTAVITTSVRAVANLSLSKVDQPDPVDAAQPLTYTLSVANAGPSMAAPVTVTDTLPVGVVFDSFVDVDASWTCNYDSATRTVTCTRPELPVGNAPAITIRMTAPNESMSLTNTAIVSTATYDPATGNNTATATTTVRSRANLAISKTASHDPVYAGELLTYTLRISNAGPSSAQSVRVVDTLPAGATLVSTSQGSWSCAEAGGTVTCTRASLNAGSISDIEIAVRLPSEGGLIINSASVSAVTFDPDTSNNTASASTTVIARADLALVKSDDPDPVNVGSTLTYTLQVSNAGPSTLQTRTTTVTTTQATTISGYGAATPYSSTLTVSAITGKVTKVTVRLNKLNHTRSDDVDILLVGPGGQAVLLMSDAGGDNALSNATLTFDDAAAVALPDSTAISSGSYRPANYTGNDGTGDSFSDPAPAAPYATTLGVFNNLDPNGPWRIFIFDDRPEEGGLLVDGWQLAITTEEAVTVVDTLPAEVSYVTAGGAGWSCAYASATHQVICQRDTLLVETAPAITIQVTAPITGTVITNTAVLSGTILDHFPANNTAVITTSVQVIADLSLTKIGQPDPVDAAQPLTYTLSVANAGPSMAAPVTVTDTLPPELTFVSASGDGWTCGFDSPTHVVTCSSAGFAAGAAPDISIVTTAPTEGMTLTNSASVISPMYDPTPGDTIVTATTAVRAIADLSIVKSSHVEQIYAGEVLTYTLLVSNAGPSTATAVQVVDTLPPGTTLLAVEGKGWSCSESGGTVSCTRDSLVVGAAPQLLLRIAAATEGGVMINSASVSSAVDDPDPSNNSTTVSTIVIPQADLSIAKSASPDPVNAGATLTYTLSVASAGPSTIQPRTITPANSTALTIPDLSTASLYGSPITLTAVTGKISKVTVTLNSLNHAWPDDLDILLVGPGGQAVLLMSDAGGGNTLSNVTLTFDDAAAAALPDSAAISSGSYRPANYTGNDGANDSFVAPAPASPYTTTLAAFNNLDPNGTWQLFIVDDEVTEGGSLAGGWQLAITTEEAVTVVDTLPAEVSFVAAGGDGWSCIYAGATHQVTCQRNTLLVETAPAITIQVTAPVAGTELSNTATVSAPLFDSDQSNNTATITTTARDTANLSIVKSASAATVDPLAPLTYTLRVSSTGPTAASAVTVTDTLPDGITFVSATGQGWSCSEAGGTVTCELQELAPGSAPELTIVVIAPGQSSTITNTATVTAATFDPDLANNVSSVSTNVNSAADLAIVKSASAEPANAGSTLTYTLSITNSGPDPATAVTVTDQLPNEVTFLGAAGDGWTCSQAAGSVTCTRPTLAAGNAPPITITVTTPDEPTTITNQAMVSSATTDLDQTNNSTSLATTVAAVADVSISATSALDGLNVIYTFIVQNAGPSATSGTILTATLPLDISFISSSPAAPTCTLSGRIVTCNLGPLARNGTVQVRIETALTAKATSSVTTIAEVMAPQYDPQLLNNTLTELTYLTLNRVYLPVLLGPPLVPDLVGSFTLTPNKLNFSSDEPVGITVIVTNTGSAATGPFWVDFYINPSVQPTQANMLWYDLCTLDPCQGIAWYVAGGLGPNQSITLTSTPDSYASGHTIWSGSFVPGTTDLYLYVDVWNPGVATGMVKESDEANNRAELHGLSVTGTTTARPGQRRADELPARPLHDEGR
ncbi:MAG: hypothetical protein KatS3mg057_3059 [Herpetosiphonaceae bacterium]|nr:MAG: hypothetical protein KatS3mg057_3059 [Herpetosiphonaceae bacterium]